jgi:F0F1-type ATP synthase assembly protein I
VKRPNPSGLVQLSTAGMTVISTVVAGFALGWLASRFLHWDWAIPIGILLGFAAGMLSMFRQLSGDA